jgi:hypothetical protein
MNIIRWNLDSPEEHELIVPSGECLRPVDDFGDYRAALESVEDVSLSSLRRTFVQLVRREWGYDIRSKEWDGGSVEPPQWRRYSCQLIISDDSTADFDPEYSTFSPVHLNLCDDGHLILRVFVFVSGDLDEDAIPGLVEPYLTRKRASLINYDLEGSGSQAYWELNIALRSRGRTVGNAYEIGAGVADLLYAVAAKQPNFALTLDLLLAGKVDIFLGQHESDWLEVKSQPYLLDGESSKIELAQDVARFANSEQGGILIIGFGTKRVPGGEVLNRIRPFHFTNKDVRRYRDVLDRRLFPPVDNMRIERIAFGSGYLAAICVPAQREELKPFLVQGAIVDKRCEGAFISIVRRRGEGSIPISAPAIHAWIAAGRALLRNPSSDTEIS